jgi:hypothetical protein
MKASKNVVLSEDNLNVRPNFTNQRNTIILREIPSNTSVDEVKALFSKNSDLVQPSTVRSDIGDHWFIQFDQEDDCLKAFMWLNSQKFNDKPIQKRIKSENILRGLYTSAEGGMDGGYLRGPGRGPFGGGYGQLIPIPQAKGARMRNNMGPGRSAAQRAPNVANGDGTAANGARAKKPSSKKKGAAGAKAAAADGAVAASTNPGFTLQSQAFPALVSSGKEKKKPSGYQKDFKKYSREEMVELVKKLAGDAASLNRPDGMASDCPVVLAKADCALEIDKPLPPPIPMAELYGMPGVDDSDDDEPKARRHSKEGKATTAAPSGKESREEAPPMSAEEKKAAAEKAAAEKEELEKKKQEAAEKKAEASKTSYAAMLKKSESGGTPKDK